MEIGPIFRAMLRNKLGVILITLQIAFTMTVVVNAIYIINERSRLMARPSGLDEASLFYFRSAGFVDDFNEESVVPPRGSGRSRMPPGRLSARRCIGLMRMLSIP